MALTLADRRAKAEVKAAIDLVELVREQGVKLRQQGDKWLGLCPLHKEDTGSFNVYADHYHCRKNQASDHCPPGETADRYAQSSSITLSHPLMRRCGILCWVQRKHLGWRLILDRSY